MFTIILGTVMEVNPMSAKERFERKRYKGVWGWGSGVRVRGDGQDDEQVPQHGDQLHGQEDDKEQRLQFWII